MLAHEPLSDIIIGCQVRLPVKIRTIYGFARTNNNAFRVRVIVPAPINTRSGLVLCRHIKNEFTHGN